MCECRDGNFVVPVRPAAGMGWWLGQVLSVSGRFYHINVLWIENPEYIGNNVISSTSKYIEECVTIAEAIDRLKSKGMFIPVPVKV